MMASVAKFSFMILLAQFYPVPSDARGRKSETFEAHRQQTPIPYHRLINIRLICIFFSYLFLFFCCCVLHANFFRRGRPKGLASPLRC